MKSVRLSGFDYRAANQAYFVTAKFKLPLQETVCSKLFEALLQLIGDSEYTCDALVVMPDHIHVLVRAGDSDRTALSDLVCILKSKSVYLLKQENLITESFWQRGYHEHVIRGPVDLKEKLTYIVNNPIRASLVEVEETYRYLYVAALEKGRRKAAPYAMEET
ncbi:MAG: transposase [candidate division Zixibacteria bacterium]|nr:transposase [candidate division Zixibacteria bacterium]MDH3936677.1 transposase [candidate division Zixibacteria bacterium]MDH4034500.1 transposase [candidate division Zixibacteria bacterium]